MLNCRQLDLFPFLEDISPQTHLKLDFGALPSHAKLSMESNIVWRHWSSGCIWLVGSENKLKHCTLDLFKDLLLSCFLKFEISPDICPPSFLFSPLLHLLALLGFPLVTLQDLWIEFTFFFFPTRIAVPASIKFHLKTQIYRSSSIKILKSSPFRLWKGDRTSGSCHVCVRRRRSFRTRQPAAASGVQPSLQEERKIIYFILYVLGRENVSLTPYIKSKPI